MVKMKNSSKKEIEKELKNLLKAWKEYIFSANGKVGAMKAPARIPSVSSFPVSDVDFATPASMIACVIS